jgi:hypothetical protein
MLQVHRFLLRRTAGPYIRVRNGLAATSTECPLTPPFRTKSLRHQNGKEVLAPDLWSCGRQTLQSACAIVR